MRKKIKEILEWEEFYKKELHTKEIRFVPITFSPPCLEELTGKTITVVFSPGGEVCNLLGLTTFPITKLFHPLHINFYTIGVVEKMYPKIDLIKEEIEMESIRLFRKEKELAGGEK